MSRTFNFRWNYLKPITMYLVDDGLCPFPDEAEIQLRHQCDYISYVTFGNIPLVYGGRVDSYPGFYNLENQSLYTRFVDEENDYWAHAYTRTSDGTTAVGGRINYTKNKVITPDRFAGISPHELCHILRFKHAPFDSMMQNNPYLEYQLQALFQVEDFRTLELTCGPVRMIPSVNPVSQIIRIPSIQIAPGIYNDVILFCEKDDNGWRMHTTPQHCKQVFIADNTSFIQDNKLHFPLRFEQRTIQVTADIHHTNSRTEFVNVRLEKA